MPLHAPSMTTTIRKGKPMEITQQAKDIAEAATRLPNDINGNPRYYVWYYAFDGIRPPFANMYRGKKYGAGWVFQSYYLADTIQRSLNQINKEG